MTYWADEIKKVKKDKNICGATIEFGDDYGDNCCTCICRLPKGHKGNHTEKGNVSPKIGYIKPYILEWEDERKKEEK